MKTSRKEITSLYHVPTSVKKSVVSSRSMWIRMNSRQGMVVRRCNGGNLCQGFLAKLMTNLGKGFAITICQGHATVDLLTEYAILGDQVCIAKAGILVHRLGDRPQQLFPVHASFYPCHSVLH